MWESVLAELDAPAPSVLPAREGDEAGGAGGREVDLDPIRANLTAELARLQRFAHARQTQDLPVQAVLVGWKGECAAWRAETQRKARFQAAGLSLPALGWFRGLGDWWPSGLARDPVEVDLEAQSEVAAWVDEAVDGVEPLILSPLPEYDELSDPTARLGLAIVRDAVQGVAVRALDELRRALLAGFLVATRTALDAWYENRGAAPLAVLDDMRFHIEYAAARRHYVGVIPVAMEEATTTWAASDRQPQVALMRLIHRMEKVLTWNR